MYLGPQAKPSQPGGAPSNDWSAWTGGGATFGGGPDWLSQGGGQNTSFRGGPDWLSGPQRGGGGFQGGPAQVGGSFQGGPAPAGNQQQAPQQGQQMNVQSAVQPQGVYPGTYTQQAGNLAAAAAIPARPDLAAAVARPGISIDSPASQYGMGLLASQGLSQAATAPSLIGMSHGFQNLGNMLAGQQARDQGSLGYAGLGVQDKLGMGQIDLTKQGHLLNFLSNMNQWWM